MSTHKEDIAKKYVPCRCDEIYTSRGLTAPDCPYHSTDPETAMDEYAHQQAIAFAEWGFKDDNPFVEGSNGRWIQQCGNSTSWSTEELYNQFIEQQNKP